MIERDLQDGILTLRLAHGKASALDVEFLEALIRELDAAADARAVVLTGRGAIFSAGVDLFRLAEGGPEYVERFFSLLDAFVRKLVALPVPVVAAANGHAIAGGCIVVLACDYRLMADGGGRIGVPELLVGLPFPAAPLEVVRFAVPPQHLQSLVYTGRTLPPREALAHGLVDEVVDPGVLDARAREVAGELARIPAEVFRLTKQSLRAPVIERLARTGEAVDAQALALWAAPETPSRVRAYLEKVVRR